MASHGRTYASIGHADDADWVDLRTWAGLGQSVAPASPPDTDLFDRFILAEMRRWRESNPGVPREACRRHLQRRVDALLADRLSMAWPECEPAPFSKAAGTTKGQRPKADWTSAARDWQRLNPGRSARACQQALVDSGYQGVSIAMVRNLESTHSSQPRPILRTAGEAAVASVGTAQRQKPPEVCACGMVPSRYGMCRCQ